MKYSILVFIAFTLTTSTYALNADDAIDYMKGMLNYIGIGEGEAANNETVPAAPVNAKVPPAQPESLKPNVDKVDHVDVTPEINVAPHHEVVEPVVEKAEKPIVDALPRTVAQKPDQIVQPEDQHVDPIVHVEEQIQPPQVNEGDHHAEENVVEHTEHVEHVEPVEHAEQPGHVLIEEEHHHENEPVAHHEASKHEEAKLDEVKHEEPHHSDEHDAGDDGHYHAKSEL